MPMTFPLFTWMIGLPLLPRTNAALTSMRTSLRETSCTSWPASGSARDAVQREQEKSESLEKAHRSLFPRPHCGAITHRIGRMHDDALAFRQPAAHFRCDAVVMRDLDFRQPRLATVEHERHPVAAAPE